MRGSRGYLWGPTYRSSEVYAPEGAGDLLAGTGSKISTNKNKHLPDWFWDNDDEQAGNLKSANEDVLVRGFEIPSTITVEVCPRQDLEPEEAQWEKTSKE